ncbi:MAG: HEAT repeat domain-containing protein [Desulfomicrobium escambiense]|nr:HEAT repeat domain-containing protein [Desulfomicrobium escambiense]
MRHVASHLDTSDERVVAAARRFCLALGTVAIRPLAEVLSREERNRPRKHLIDVLTGFGAAGRQAVESLRQSPNAAVRRTAVLLLREFGGQEALPELESLLDDAEPHVQREATRAIATLGVDSAYDTLIRALERGSEQARTSILGVLWTLPHEDAEQVLAHLTVNAPCRGAMWARPRAGSRAPRNGRRPQGRRRARRRAASAAASGPRSGCVNLHRLAVERAGEDRQPGGRRRRLAPRRRPDSARCARRRERTWRPRGAPTRERNARHERRRPADSGRRRRAPVLHGMHKIGAALRAGSSDRSARGRATCPDAGAGARRGAGGGCRHRRPAGGRRRHPARRRSRRRGHRRPPARHRD